MVTLESDPSGATLYYKIGSLKEYQFTTDFPMERNESLRVRASAMNGADVFVRWEDPSSILGTTATLSVPLPATGDTALFTAIYANPLDTLRIDLEQTGGANADLSFTINGDTFPYVLPFRVLRTDTLSVEASNFGSYEFVRWQDSADGIIGISASEDIDLSSYASESSVTLTAVFAAAGERVMVSLDSQPFGATLYYKIGTLNEVTYSGAFPMERNEALRIKASAMHGTDVFVRWEDDAPSVIGTTATLPVTLPATGTTASFTAIYADSVNTLLIDIIQTGGANADVSYTVNGDTLQYTAPFRVLKTDVVSVEAFNYAPYEFVRWQDNLGNIVGTSDSESLNMSLYMSESSITLKAVFAAAGERMTVTLESDPTGATLYYKIGSLKEYEFTGDFPMERSESLTIRASATNGADGFVRWEDDVPAVIGTTAALSVTLPATGTTALFTAIYAPSSNTLEITLGQIGGALVTYEYTVNGTPDTYTIPFTVLKTDVVTIEALWPGTEEFVRWQDSIGNIVGTSVLEAVDMSLYASESAVIITAVFAAAGDRLMVTLESDPSGATLYYKVGSLKEYEFTTDFPMGRSESLTIRASTMLGTAVFVRWEDDASSMISTTVSTAAS
jgi:hypothetical protein